MDDLRRTDLAFKLLDNVQNLIKFADTKTVVLLVISGVTTTFVMTNFNDLFGLCVISKIVLVLFILSFLIFIWYSIKTISPQSDKHTTDSAKKLIYYGHIAKMEVSDFIDKYSNISDKEFLDDILYQVYENSKIASNKFNYYKTSLIAIGFQIYFFFFILTLKFIV